MTLCLLIVSWLFFLTLQPVNAQHERAYMILWVTPESELTIKGRTNMNTFNCTYTDPLTDTVWVEIEKNSNIYRLQNTSVDLRVDAFDCGGKIINKDFRKLLKHKEFGTITVQFQSFEPYTGHADNRLGSIMTEFELVGRTKLHPIDIIKTGNTGSENYYGITGLDITQFDLKPPTKLLGVVKVDKNIEVEFNLYVVIIEPLQDIGPK